MEADEGLRQYQDRAVALMGAFNCNCAEAVIRTMGERFGFDTGVSRFGTALGAGMSGNADLCGLLTGGMLVIGLKFGRLDCDDLEKKRRCYEIGSEYFRWFMGRFGRCSDLKGDPKVGPWDKCHDAAREAVAFLIDLIDRNLR